MIPIKINENLPNLSTKNLYKLHFFYAYTGEKLCLPKHLYKNEKFKNYFGPKLVICSHNGITSINYLFQLIFTSFKIEKRDSLKTLLNDREGGGVQKNWRVDFHLPFSLCINLVRDKIFQYTNVIHLFFIN